MPFTLTLPTAVPGQFIFGADVTTMLAALHALSDPWTSWTPVLTGSTTNPGVSSATGAYIQVGKFVVFHASITLSSAGSGSYSVTIPVTSGEPTGSPIGVSTLLDNSAPGANRFFRSAWQNSNTSVGLGAEDSTRVTNAVPFTFASGDIIAVKGTYEAA